MANGVTDLKEEDMREETRLCSLGESRIVIDAIIRLAQTAQQLLIRTDDNDEPRAVEIDLWSLYHKLPPVLILKPIQEIRREEM
ncbi:hypothetical protein Tcan_11730 [Toxocara canis]|uniref:Uncharacterized protein n=1 Tax=Toxocara canis TaxID=6265 RepID=A0A0B2UWA4_TOXCA|nr:hypothetical protein Tcan_11730 [Toxocara canis]